jgi:AbrB family looped-hinge helix DNA binding protein
VTETIQVRIDEGGAIIIPTDVGETLGLRPGMTLLVREQEGDLHLVSSPDGPRIVMEEDGLPAIHFPPGVQVDFEKLVEQGREERLLSLLGGGHP